MINFQRESLADVRIAGIEDLLQRHWQEIAQFKDIPVSVDWPMYEAVEQLDKLRIFTARTDKCLVGYAAFMVFHHGHYSSLLQAIQDVLYLAPEQRKGRVGYRLIRFAEAELAAEGVRAVCHPEKVGHPALGRLLKAMDYQPAETLWIKRLDRDGALH